MDVWQMHTINAVENRRMSKRSSANLFRFHELLLVTDNWGGKLPLRGGWVIFPISPREKKMFWFSKRRK